MRAKKALGQHFLADFNYCRKIVRYASLDSDDLVVEIGPGTGQLTAAILQSAARVIAIEFDDEMIDQLASRFSREMSGAPPRLEIIAGDVLQLDWAVILPDRPVKLMGNLPYNVSTRILAKTTEFKQRFHSFTFMVQKEVARRILAEPGSRDYGYFTLFMAYHFDRQAGFDVPPGVFRPPPKVESHVMKVLPVPAALSHGEEYAAFLKLIRSGFRQRRKTVRNNLRAAVASAAQLEELLRACGVGAGKRAEQLDLQHFLCLSRVLYSLNR